MNFDQPAEHLEEEFPDVAAFLRSLSGEPASTSTPQQPDIAMPSNLATDVASERLTNNLLANVQDIMRRAETDGSDPDEELREVVGRALVEGMTIGREWDVHVGGGSGDAGADEDGGAGKRPRMENGGS